MQIGYFAQNQAQMLDENLTVFGYDNVATGDIRLKTVIFLRRLYVWYKASTRR